MSIGWIEVAFVKAQKGTGKVSGENVSSFSFVSKGGNFVSHLSRGQDACDI